MRDLKEHLDFELNERFLFEMAQIGDLDNKLIIYVRSNEGGNIPHFHIVDKQTLGSKFHTCVKIENATYFHHTGKEDVLNSKQRKRLVDFLNSMTPLENTYWEFLLLTWNINNSNRKVNINQKMPDYTNLN